MNGAGGPSAPPGGARVTCLGGGHGLAASLRAAVPWAGDVAAVVSVADDGGSSGRLRGDLGIVPPGDLRRCLNALAATGSVLGGALEQRFGSGDLEGHALGNLLIAGLVEHGLTVEEALAEVGRLVGARGRVIPAAVVPVTLTGDQGDDVLVEGQARVEAAERLRRIELRPADPPTPAAAVEAIVGADLVVLGPGSLFTSVLAVALVPAVADALARTGARRVLVVNLGPQPGETQGLSPDDHVRAVVDHGVPFDVVLADPRFAPVADHGVEVVVRAVGVDDRAIHDPGRLGGALADLAAAVAAADHPGRGV